MICVLYIWGGSLRGLSAGLKNQTVWVRLPPAPPVTSVMISMPNSQRDVPLVVVRNANRLSLRGTKTQANLCQPISSQGLSFVKE